MEELRIPVGERHAVSGVLVRPAAARALFVCAHGAGAGMRHAFLESFASTAAERGIATLRYQFPYMEAGGGPPDPPGLLQATVRAAVEAGRSRAGDLPLVAGGKSMGGRMTSLAQSQRAMEGVLGLAFLGFPLHPAGRPSIERGEHLPRVEVPMLFLQGTRDRLAELDLLRPILQGIGARATLHEVAQADHSFHVPKKSGRDDDDVLSELVDAIAAWMPTAR